MAGKQATSCALLPLLNSKLYPAKHKILPLNMCGVTAYHLLNLLSASGARAPTNQSII
ncbi:hypothetical protein Hanom_Chr00s167001g01827231 [Helianthus anomalus]